MVELYTALSALSPDPSDSPLKSMSFPLSVCL